jgi:ferredoxin-NADP reductase
MVRQYSLCGDVHDCDTYRIAVLRTVDGRGGSASIHENVVAGQRLAIRGPRNNFALRPAPRYRFIAGGIGITPIVPMVAAAQRAGADWTLAYGGRSLVSMAFRDELRQRYGDRVTLVPQDEDGLLDLDGLLGSSDPDTLVYCCGPEQLLSAVEQRCAGWPADALHVERFSPRENETAGDSGEFEVEFARSGVTITVAADVALVDAAAEAGVMIDTSCREGTCGTCETKVLDGVPDHRDSLLTADERARNDVMFPCVSRSCGGKLVLDC